MPENISSDFSVSGTQYSDFLGKEKKTTSKSEEEIDAVGKENLNPNAQGTSKSTPVKGLGSSQIPNVRKGLAEVAEHGVASVKSQVSKKEGTTFTQGGQSSSSTAMPTKEQMKTAVYRPFFPGAEVQDNEEVLLNDIEAHSITREMGTGTANTTGMYRTTIDGKEYFVKRVPLQVAQSAAVVDDVAKRLGLEAFMLPTTFIENPGDSKTAFLLTPMLEEVNDVESETLKSVLGDKTEDFLMRMAVFDHIIGNTDRSNMKQLMESGGRIYLADNDNSLETSSLDFETRTGGHIIEIYAEDLECDYKSLEIPADLIAAAEDLEKDIETITSSIADDSARADAQKSIQSGLKGMLALKNLDREPRLADLREGSEMMDHLLYGEF